jgi:hypothetical protein
VPYGSRVLKHRSRGLDSHEHFKLSLSGERCEVGITSQLLAS